MGCSSCRWFRALPQPWRSRYFSILLKPDNPMPQMRTDKMGQPATPDGDEKPSHRLRLANLAFLALSFTGWLNGCASRPAVGSVTGKLPPGFVSVFNGRDFTGWAGPIENYEIKDGAIVCRPNRSEERRVGKE